MKKQIPISYQRLVAVAESAQAKLEKDYPQLFVSDEEIKAMEKAANEAAKNDPEFKKAKDNRAAAYRAQQDYLMANDGQLVDLVKAIAEEGK